MVDDNAPAPTTETGEQNKKPLSLLAGEMFGANYHAPDEDAATEVPAQTEEAEGETAPDVEQADDATEADGETAPEAESQTSETEEETASTLTQLIEANEWDPDWVNTLKVAVKVDGTPAEATIADLVKSFQIGEAAEKRLEDAKTKARALTEEAGRIKQQFENQLTVAAKLISAAEKALDDEATGIDWTKLREDDPAEYAARKTEIGERRKGIEQMKRDAAVEVDKSLEEHRTQSQEEQTAFLREQQTMLLEKLPAWRDAETAKAEKTELVNYLIGEGFEQQDVMNAADHRLVLLGRKAMLYDKSQAKTAVAKKKVATVPKVMKPGAPKPQEQISRESVEKARSKLRKSGSMDDAMALLRAKRGAQ